MNGGADDRRQPRDGDLVVGLLIVSDRCAAGQRSDESGPALIAWLAEQRARVGCQELVPDDRPRIAELLGRWCDGGTCDLVLTCGGTGVAPRDVTPEATRDVIEREIPGLAEAMRRGSASLTPHALLSRAVVGIRRRTLVLNLPGSPRAAIENLAAVWPAVGHAVAKIQGDASDCSPLAGPPDSAPGYRAEP